MEGKLILDAEGYNGLFALPLASVNGIQGKKSTQMLTNFNATISLFIHPKWYTGQKKVQVMVHKC